MIEESLRAIAERDGAIHAFLHHDPHAVRRAPVNEGPLKGVPVAVKDNIVMRGAPTTCGSRLLEHFVSPVDATAVTRLVAAGAVIAGKTNLDEFAMGSSTEHSAFGPTLHPLDPTRVPGGSSGGSAAAVAAGMVPLALGSETGGSVRQPAAFCGILGLKPTWGRISRSGLVAFASSLDQIGLFARDATGMARLLAVLAGADPADATSSDAPVPDYEAALDEGVAGRRFGVVREVADIEGVDPDVRADFDAQIARLRSLGAVVEDVSIPTIVHSVAIYSIVANAEASSNLGRFDGMRYGERMEGATLGETYRASRGAGFGDEVKRRILLGTFALSAGYADAYYGRAQRARARMQREIAAAFERVDFLLTPTVPTPAFRLGEKLQDPLSMYLSDVFTAPANLAGIPAIAIPTGRSRDGLPLSLQVMGRGMDEEGLLAVARGLE